ncbi:type I polyketide synthase [Streptomyces sp. NPDC051677]|uniref:type I polyketide synthase n=1 Tax=Streptomyces sp. NPDC051677 TaxID=3365669 RepID=UPI0037D516BC
MFNDKADATTPEREGARREPIAVVGVGCRYPGGVSDADDLWRVVVESRDAVSAPPVNRGWDVAGRYDPDPDSPGRGRAGGFLHDADQFDAAFFGISRQEAAALDPQQRLTLEVSWEAVENAGIDPRSLRDRRIGVFLGSTILDYSVVHAAAGEAASGHLVTGTRGAPLSGRVCGTMGLRGPSQTVDTACSSSLVALHLAVRSLRDGECVAALAGGVTVMSTPSTLVDFDTRGLLAADGRCKAFGADADGFGLGEGVGVLLLERLSDARRQGHPVLALIRGTAVNSVGACEAPDGITALEGITTPDGPTSWATSARAAQERVIRDALAAAGVPAGEVDLVEAHGAGTRLGDAIEAEALTAVYGTARKAGDPLAIGSVKSNVGHTQAAAGVAGVIKAVMALRNRTLPPTLHADEVTPEADWSAGTVRPVTRAQPWSDGGYARRVGVSAFGLGGTNAHLLLEEAPGQPSAGAASGAAEVITAQGSGPGREKSGSLLLPWLLSGRSAQALAAQAAALLDWSARQPQADPLHVARALATTRSRFEHRAVLLGPDLAGLRPALAALAGGDEHPDAVTGEVRATGRIAFLFSGQGSQRPRMGTELYETFPAYATEFDAICAELDRHLRRPLREIVFADAGTAEAALLDTTEFAQPGLFAVEAALFALLDSWGVRPDLLLGHSIGEVVAAYVSGVLSLADACAVVTARARLMQALPSGGAMAALQAYESEIVDLLREREDQVGIAAVNGPRSVVVSGDEDTVMELIERWQARGRLASRLNVSHAFHSPRMDGMLDDFLQVTSSVEYHAPSVPVVSNATGEPASATQLSDPRYWVDHVRGTVRFADGVRTLVAEEGVTTFVEVGPDRVLTGMAADSLGDRDALRVAVLHRDRPEARSALTALARLHCQGVPVDLAPLLPGRGAHVDLPTYSFQRERHWLDAAPRATTGDDARLWRLVSRADTAAVAAELGVGEHVGLPELLPALARWRDRPYTDTGTALPATSVLDRPAPPAPAPPRRTALPDGPVAGPEPVLAEIDRLDELLAGLSLDEQASAAVVARLRELTRALSPAPTGDSPPVELANADADSVLAFITNQLGIGAEPEAE